MKTQSRPTKYFQLMSFIAFVLVSMATSSVDANQLRETRALEADLSTTQTSIRSTRTRTERLNSKVRNVRKQMESIKQLIAGLKKAEDKIRRLEREVNSFARIPKLSFLRPLGKGLKSLRENVAKVRQRGDELNRKVIAPNIKRARTAESKLKTLIAKLRGLESKNAQARQNISQLRLFVEARISQRQIVAALEQLARSTRQTVGPFKSALTQLDQKGARVESMLNSFSNSANALLSLRGGLDKLNRTLAPVDKKVKGLAKVLDKKIVFKIPLSKKKVTFSIRKILEAPGKILKVAVKPLTKIAEKALKPFSKKFRINLKAPAEIARMQKQLEQLTRANLGLDLFSNASDQFQNSVAVRNFERSLNSVIQKRTTQLN